MNEIIDNNVNKDGENPINYNQNLMGMLTNLREKREAVNIKIVNGEEEKTKITKDIEILGERLKKVESLLSQDIEHRNQYDKTIKETEAAYMKILESSRTLIDLLDRETTNLTKN